MALELECVYSANKDNVMCMICQDTMKDPHLVSCCSNSFCKSCIRKLRERQKERTRCPNCSKQGFRSVLNLDLRNVIDDQLVYCHYKSAGCKWEGRRCEFETHIKQSCEYLMIECEYGCGHKCFRRDKKNHLASDGICLNSRLKRALAALESKEGHIKELQTAAKTAAKIHQKKLEGKQTELQDLKQKFENLQKKRQGLKNELDDSQKGRQRIEGKLQDLQKEERRLKSELQDLQSDRQLIERESRLEKQLSAIKLKEKEDENNCLLGLAIIVFVVFAYFYIQNLYHARTKMPHIIKTEVAEHVSLYSNDSFLLNIEHCWKFELFVAKIYFYDREKMELYASFGARISLPNQSLFRASVIVQVINSSGHNHHVSRIDTLFQVDAVDKTWYTTSADHLMSFSKPDTNSALKLRIVNVEYGANDILSYHFSMCHLKHYQKKWQLKMVHFSFLHR